MTLVKKSLGTTGYRTTILEVRKVRASQAAQGVIPLHRKVRTSGTERMSRAMIFFSGTGEMKGAAGVKTAKLCVKQDQIGKQLSVAARSFRVDRISRLVTADSDEW